MTDLNTTAAAAVAPAAAAKPAKTAKPAMAARTPKPAAAPKAEKPAKAAKPLSARAAIQAAAEKGMLPAAPDFTAETHRRYRPKLEQLIQLAKVGDLAGLKVFPIKPISTSPRAMDRYRNLCVLALEAKAAA